MDSIELLRNQIEMGGIKSSPEPSRIHPFNVKNLTFFMLMCVSVGSGIVAFNQANSFDECTDILFKTVSTGVWSVLYEMVVWKTSKLLEFVNNLANNVNESEL